MTPKDLNRLEDIKDYLQIVKDDIEKLESNSIFSGRGNGKDTHQRIFQKTITALSDTVYRIEELVDAIHDSQR